MNSYEFLKFLTVSLNAKQLSDTKENICRATGFYVTIDGAAYIVTAKHFAEDTEQNVTISAHYIEDSTLVTLPITAYVEWEVYDEFDIAYCSIKPFEKKFKEITGRGMFYTTLSGKNIMTKEEFCELNILSEVVSMGYPLGASSTHHEFPLFRKGYLASMPRDFTEDGEGYLDMRAEEGMSGSPIILNDSPLKLVGVLVQYIRDKQNITPSTAIYVSADKVLDMIKDTRN